MKRTLKKALASFMSFVLVLTTMLSFSLSVASAATYGDCTTTIKWSYNASTKTLTISGTGVMPDYRASNLGTNKRAPWEENKIGTSTIKSLVEKIVIEEGITEIGEYNFYNCVSAKSVSLPSTLISIDGTGVGTEIASASYGAFQNCTSLTEIALPDNLKTIEPYAFKNCTALKYISFPNSLTSLGRCAFMGCSSLETVTFGTGLTETGAYAFDTTGVKRINWGSITDISERSFYNSGVKDLEFPESIKSIGNRAFSNSKFLMSVKVNNANTAFNGTNNTNSNSFSGSSQNVTIYGHSASTAQAFAASCGYTFVSIDDCDHEDTRVEIIKEATCTEAGTQQEVCNTCGFIVSETEIEALGHDFVLDAENNSTELDGHIYRSYKCTRCDETKEEVEHQRESALRYVWVDGYYTLSYVTEPTCTTPGLAVYTCNVEGCKNALGTATYERRVVNSGHKVENWDETPATCTEAGKREGVCTVCGETITETIPAKGHKYTDDDLVETIETEEDGHIHYYFRCQNCGKIVEEIEHTEWIADYYTREALTRATCTISGLARDTCTVCGETRTQIIQATGEHEYVETERTEPDCTKRGTITYECVNCGQTRTEYVAALGHDYVLDENQSIAATCTESGKNVYTCSVCSATKQETVAAKGHTAKEGTYEIITAPTCTKAGLAVAECEVCSEAYEATVDALGHDFVDVETDLTSDGKPGHVLAIPTCTRCGATQSGRTVHKEWIEGYYETRDGRVSTCHYGYTTDVCTVKGCNETRVNQIEGQGHMYFYTGVQTYEGVTLFCPHCLSTEVVPASTLMQYWNEGNYINYVPKRTATNNSGFLDLNRSGLINAKDYAMLLKLVQQEEKLIEEHNQSIIDSETEENLENDAEPVDPASYANDENEETE